MNTQFDAMLTAAQAAEEAAISLPALWKMVAAGRLPPPYYPAPRAPRWRRSELIAAIEATRALPREARLAREGKPRQYRKKDKTHDVV
jgi:predicted DNA-binding transcriptional regulator AlpA